MPSSAPPCLSPSDRALLNTFHRLNGDLNAIAEALEIDLCTIAQWAMNPAVDQHLNALKKLSRYTTSQRTTQALMDAIDTLQSLARNSTDEAIQCKSACSLIRLSISQSPSKRPQRPRPTATLSSSNSVFSANSAFNSASPSSLDALMPHASMPSPPMPSPTIKFTRTHYPPRPQCEEDLTNPEDQEPWEEEVELPLPAPSVPTPIPNNLGAIRNLSRDLCLAIAAQPDPYHKFPKKKDGTVAANKLTEDQAREFDTIFLALKRAAQIATAAAREDEEARLDQIEVQFEDQPEDQPAAKPEDDENSNKPDRTHDLNRNSNPDSDTS